MAAEQLIQWIALPCGVSEDRESARLAVFVAPRLRTDDGVELRVFPDFLDWPARLNDPHFNLQVEVDGVGALPATRVSPPPSSPLWQALFPATTPLIPFAFDDFADRPLVSHSITEIVRFLRGTYASAAALGIDDLPLAAHQPDQEAADLARVLRPLRDLLHQGVFDDVANDDDLRDRIADRLRVAREEARRRRAGDGPRAGPPIEPFPADGSIAREFERLVAFHRRPAPEVLLRDDENTRAAVRAAFDFHRLLSALGDHPYLLRLLGLVLDVTVPAPAIPAAKLAEPGHLRARPSWAPSGRSVVNRDHCPTIAFFRVLSHLSPLGGADAVPARACFGAAPAEVHDTPPGFLALPSTEFDAIQVDADGAGLKTLATAVTLDAMATRQAASDQPIGEPSTGSLPAIRTSGIALTHAHRAGELQRHFGRSLELEQTLAANDDVVLFADDLVRGYRLDVRDQATGRWRSLHHRHVAYAITALAGKPLHVEDEGFFQVSAAEPTTAPGQTPDPDGELYVHENLVTWDGWSLAVPLPGSTIAPDPRSPDDETPATSPGGAPLTAMGLEITTEPVRGTLPRLRFGHGYRLRVRTVDLAGNGLTEEEADTLLADNHSGSAILPTVTPNTPEREGIGGFSGDLFPYLRYEPVPAPVVVPTAPYPEGTSLLRLVIRSDAGMSSADYSTAFAASDLVIDDHHQPYAPVDERHVVAPKAPIQLIERHGLFDNAIGSDGAPPDDDQRTAINDAYELASRERRSLADRDTGDVELVEIHAADDHPPQHYAIHREPQLTTPYLPDPLSDGVVLFGLPGLAPDEPYGVSWDADSRADPRAFRLRLAEGDGPPVWDERSRVLTVPLPQAGVRTIRMACAAQIEVTVMGMLRWCRQELPGDEYQRVREAAEASRHWLFTPWHEVTLVHAVQHPLRVPELSVDAQQRPEGESTVELTGSVDLDAASTECIDLVGTWSEWIDDPELPKPERRTRSDIVFRLPLAVAATHPQGPLPPPYTLEDGKRLTFSVPAARELGLPFPPGHALGDTKYRSIAYTAVAASEFREYFPSTYQEDLGALSVTGDPVTLEIPSSARPAPPHVLYVVPTQTWDGDAADLSADGRTVRRRSGGGMRIYLDRPWYSSGDDELLGIVVGDDLVTPASPTYPYMTLLGRDPARASAPVGSATVGQFRGEHIIFEPVRLPGLPHDVVSSIVAYRVTFDEPTNRWVADIDLDLGDAYFPFVRLALVRYQPHAIPDREASTVVVTNIVQPLPDRVLTIVRPADDASKLEISLQGPSYTAVAAATGTPLDTIAPGRVVARIEERDGAIRDATLGWRAVPNADYELTPASDAYTFIWTGTVTVPPGPGQRRVVVQEDDRLPTDPGSGAPSGVIARTIYVDAISL